MSGGLPRRLRSRLAAPALYAALALALFLPLLRGGQVFAFRDLADYAIPHKLWAASELKRGALPLWNPHNFLGFPHLANLQSGVLYPPNVLLLLPFPLGFNLSLIVHFVIAALGARRLALELGIEERAALLAGLAFGFSPYLLSLTDLNAFLATSSWLPWLLAQGLRLGRQPSSGRIAATALLFALGFLAGEPQTFALGAGLAALASAAVAPRSLAGAGRLVRAWAQAGVVTLLLVAPVLLPFLELAGLSDRSGAGLSRQDVYQYSIEAEALPSLILPGFTGDVVAGTHWLGAQTYVRVTYLGTLTLALAVVGLLGRARDRVVWLALLLGGLLLALGPQGGLYPLLFQLGFRQSRFPVKFLVLTVLAVGLLAARGVEALRGEEAARARRHLLAALGVLLLLALLFLALAPVPAAAAAARRTLVVALAALLALIGLQRGRARAAVLAAILPIDLLGAALPALTRSSAERLLAPAPGFAALKLARESPSGLRWPRVYTPPISARSLQYVYREGRFDEAALERKKSLLFGNTNLLFGIPMVRGGESMELRRTAALLAAVDRGPVARRLLDLTGAGYLVLIPQEGEARVLPNPQALPHAFLVGRARSVPAALALDVMTEPGFDPAREVLLEEDPGPLDPACGEGKAVVLHSAPDRVDLAVDAPGRCALVLTDSFYPGWTASRDGRPAAILAADHALRAVLVEKGVQQVRFRYRPGSFRLGVWAAALGLLLWLGLLAAARMRKETT